MDGVEPTGADGRVGVNHKVALFLAAMEIVTEKQWVTDEGHRYIDLDRLTSHVVKTLQRKPSDTA